MARKFKELQEKLHTNPFYEQKAEAARVRLDAEILLHERTLADLRRARQMTQKQLSMALEVGQPEISRIEHQTDLYVSTLRSYLTAMGGDLMLVATFGDECVRVSLDEVAEATLRDNDEDDELLPA